MPDEPVPPWATLYGPVRAETNLDELIADFDKVHGPADPEAVAAKRAG